MTFNRIPAALSILAAAAVTAGLLAIAPAAQADQHVDYRSYMAFGDSITLGIGTSGCTVPQGQCANSYSGQANVRGYGIGSSCIVACDDFHQIRVWLPNYLASVNNRPEVVVLMIGTNDYPAHESGEIIAAMKDLRATLSSRFGIRTVYGTITPAPAGSFWNVGQTGHAKTTRLAINDWLRGHPAYMGPEYAKPLQCNGDLCPAFVNPSFNDVHFNDYAAAVAGNALRAWIEADR